MTSHRIMIEAPTALALELATDLADADGVDLVSSAPPSIVREGVIALEVTVEGELDAVTAAVAEVGIGLPSGISVTRLPG